MYPSEQLPSNSTSAAGGGKFSAVGVILCIFLTVAVLNSPSSWNYKHLKIKKQTRKWTISLTAPKPHLVQSSEEMHVKCAKGKEIIVLHSVTSFGRKWGTAMQRGLFSLHRPDRHPWPEERSPATPFAFLLFAYRGGRKGEWEGIYLWL